jgi:hypothetical protein
VWFVAYSHNARALRRGRRIDGNGAAKDEGREGLALVKRGADGGHGAFENPGDAEIRAASNSLCKRRKRGQKIDEWQKYNSEESGTGSIIRTNSENNIRAARGDFKDFPTQSPLCGGDDGVSERLDIESVFKGGKINKNSKAFSRWRTEAIKAYGNAIVPQVAFEIYKSIQAIDKNYYDNRTKNTTHNRLCKR